METHLGPAMRLSVAEHRRLRRKYYWRRYLTAYLFLLPNFIFFFVFLVLPSWWVLYLSFHEGGILGAPRFVGLKNWWLIWQDKVAHRTLFNTVYYMLIAIPSVFVISMALALLLKRLMRGVAAIRAAIYFPTLSPIVLAALLWIFVIHPDFGILNFLLRLFGFEAVNWLGPGTALPTIAMLEVWRGTGFWTMLFLAALLSLPQELYDAAKIDGAGSWAQFRYLTLPLLRPTFVFAFIMATIFNFQLFDSVYILTDGGPQNQTATVVWYIYKNTFQFDKPGVGAAMSFIMLIIILILTFIQLAVLRRKT
jgi:ABC-type sugar transport system permease subunit